MPKCNVCGVDMAADWPSGVCSQVCLDKGQGFGPKPDLLRRAVSIIENSDDAEEHAGWLEEAKAALGEETDRQSRTLNNPPQDEGDKP